MRRGRPARGARRRSAAGRASAWGRARAPARCGWAAAAAAGGAGGRLRAEAGRGPAGRLRDACTGGAVAAAAAAGGGCAGAGGGALTAAAAAGAGAGGGRGKMAELGKKYCVYCLAEVSPLRFRCTECQDIELCPECFSAGAEIGHHRRYHGYQLVDGGRFTLWGPEAEGGWTSREEQLLLDAIEQFGFGNWVSSGGGPRAGTPGPLRLGHCRRDAHLLASAAAEGRRGRGAQHAQLVHSLQRREVQPHARGHTARKYRSGGWDLAF